MMLKLQAQQELQIDWGEMTPRRGSLLAILPKTKSEFYSFRWTGLRMFGSYEVSRHVNFGIRNKGKLKTTVGQGIANFEDLRVIDNQLVVFLSDKREGRNLLYMKTYNDSIEQEGSEVLLASYEMIKGHNKGWFQVIQSSNEEYFAVVWEIPAKGDNRDRYGFKIFNKHFEEINEGEYPLPFNREYAEIHSHHLSGKGEYFFSITEYDDNGKSAFRTILDFRALHIYHIAEDGLQDFKLDLNGRRVEAMAMTSDDENIFTITGIYGRQDEPGVEGVFYQRVNVDSSKVLSEGFKPFDKDFITLGWTEREKKRARKREERGKGEPQLYNYQMKEAIILADGSIVGTMEQFYVQSRTFSDARSGQTNTTYYYYYNDIICYKIDTNGEFLWIDKIRKFQVSTNDGGPYSSYSAFVNDEKLFFVFNDTAENYDSEGNFLNPERLEMANYSKRKNIVTLVSLNLETGEQERRPMFDRADVKTIAVPKMFSIDKKNRTVLMYTLIGQREKFGRVTY